MLAIVITAASLVWLWRSTDPDVVLPLLGRAHPVTLVLAILLVVTSLVLKALRWRSLLSEPRRMSPVEAYRIFHVSILLNNLLPFRLGDGARVLSAPVRRVATAQQALVALVVERLMDASALAVVGALTIPLFLREARRPVVFAGAPDVPAPVAAGIALAVALGVALLLLAVRRGWGRIARWDPAARLRSLRRDLTLLTRLPPHQLGLIGGLTLFAWLATFSLHYALLEAIPSPASPVHPFVLAVVVTLATNLSMLAPATPASIGVFHAAAAAPLLAAGFGSDVAIAYALLVHAVNTVPPMLVGAVCLGGPVVASRLLGRGAG